MNRYTSLNEFCILCIPKHNIVFARASKKVATDFTVVSSNRRLYRAKIRNENGTVPDLVLHTLGYTQSLCLMTLETSLQFPFIDTTLKRKILLIAI